MLQTRISPALKDADRIQSVLKSFEEGALVSVAARQNGVAPRQLSQWRSRYRAGKLRGMDPAMPTVSISQLADAK
jgi:transposase-like protein